MASKMHSPRLEALAFRIWVWARERGWNCTLLEAAEALDEPVARVARAAQVKGWHSRFRASNSDIERSARMDGVRLLGVDGLEALGVDQ